MNSDDMGLVQRCLRGEASSFRVLVDRFQGMVFGLCYRMLGQRQDAEDVTQEVFLRVFKSLRRWDSERPLKPWILQIAVNRCRTQIAKRTRRPVSSQELTADLVPARDDHRDREMAEEVQRALQTLREEYRTCFVLFYEQELSCAQIAETLNCPEGTVKTWLHRARHDLADHLRQRGITGERSHGLP